MSKIKAAVAVAAPSSFKDFVIRTAKLAVAVFIGALTIDAVMGLDVGASKAAALDAGAVIVSAVMNGLLAWANSP